jgi:hypothetical protein
MFRTQLYNPIIAYVFLGLALVATVGLLSTVILPEALPVQYSVRREAVSIAPSLSQVQRVEAARWQGWADYYQGQRIRQAETARLQGWAAYYQAQRARLADTARWQGWADYYLMPPVQPALQRSQLAAALRWTALAVYYGAAPDSVSPQLQFLLDP